VQALLGRRSRPSGSPPPQLVQVFQGFGPQASGAADAPMQALVGRCIRP